MCVQDICVWSSCQISYPASRIIHENVVVSSMIVFAAYRKLKPKPILLKCPLTHLESMFFQVCCL